MVGLRYLLLRGMRDTRFDKFLLVLNRNVQEVKLPMDRNPYELPSSTSAATKTRACRWLVWSGVACLVLAGLCMAASVLVIMVGMLHSLSSDEVLRPSEIAREISIAIIPSALMIPLGVLGILLLILGFVIRRPVDKREDKA